MPTDDAVPFATTVRVRDACLCLHTQRAARAMARRFDAALRPAGLSSGQFSLLMALNRPEPVAIGPIASLLGMDRTTLTAALKPAVRLGLVRVEPAASDRRRRLLTLTAAGRAALVAAMPIWTREHAALERRVSDSGRLRADLLALGGDPIGG